MRILFIFGQTHCIAHSYFHERDDPSFLLFFCSRASHKFSSVRFLSVCTARLDDLNPHHALLTISNY